MGEDVGSIFGVLRKVRKREPMWMTSWLLRGRSFPIADRCWPSPSPLPYSASDASTCLAALNTCTEPHRQSAPFSGWYPCWHPRTWPFGCSGAQGWKGVCSRSPKLHRRPCRRST